MTGRMYHCTVDVGDDAAELPELQPILPPVQHQLR